MSSQLAIEVEHDKVGAAARSRLYGWFSFALSFPGYDPDQQSGTNSFPPDFKQTVQELPFMVPAINKQFHTLVDYSVEELRIRYTNLFDSVRGAAAAPLNESEFVDSPRSMVWEELIRFYEHFGLQYDGETTRQWPDHLVIELECIQYLSFLQAGIKDDTSPLVQAQYDFIERHLLNWLPKLAGRLEHRKDREPYAGILELLHLCLINDQTYLLEELSKT